MADDARAVAGAANASPTGAGERGGASGPVDEGANTLPTPMDALGRELLAIRAMLVGLTSLVDAALVNARIVSMGGAARAFAAQPSPGDVLDAIRNAGRPKKGAVPRTFGDGLDERPASDADAEQVHVPPIS